MTYIIGPRQRNKVDRYFFIDAVAWISGKLFLAWDNRELQASDKAVKKQNDL